MNRRFRDPVSPPPRIHSRFGWLPRSLGEWLAGVLPGLWARRQQAQER